jgi:predicted nucleic acid-binding protein
VTTLVDTNVLLDLVTDDEEWADWSIAQLDSAAFSGPILINKVIYAELAVRFDTLEGLDKSLRQAGVAMAAMPKAALFLAGQVFRKRGAEAGAGVPPDCFIGAHAAVERLPLVTRYPERYRRWFPTVKLISPHTSEVPH